MKNRPLFSPALAKVKNRIKKLKEDNNENQITY